MAAVAQVRLRAGLCGRHSGARAPAGPASPTASRSMSARSSTTSRPGTARWPRPRRSSRPAPSAASTCPWSIWAAASRRNTSARRRSSNPTARRSSARCASTSATRIPNTIIEPGRGLVGNAGMIEAEVVLIAKRNREDDLRWVYLDIGKFHGLAETIDESIRYPIKTAKDKDETGAVRGRRTDLRLGRRALREEPLPAAGVARDRRQGADRGDRRLHHDATRRWGSTAFRRCGNT